MWCFNSVPWENWLNGLCFWFGLVQIIRLSGLGLSCIHGQLEGWLETGYVRQNSKMILGGFPGGAVVENLPANAGDTGSSPGLGRSHMLWSN